MTCSEINKLTIATMQVEALREQLADAQATVEALQRVRDEFERERDQLHAALMEAKAALDAERERSKKQAEEAMVVFSKLSQLQALVRALPVVGIVTSEHGYVKTPWEVLAMFADERAGKSYAGILRYRATMDATTPDSNQLGDINDMVSKGGDGE